MLKNPKVGQTVVTGRKKCCDSMFKEGTVAKIGYISANGRTIGVRTENDYWYHCPKCLRRPKKGETL